MTDILAGLVAAVQYRRKDQTEAFDPWHTMAAFDTMGPAQWYFEMQGKTEGCPWEYRLTEIALPAAPVMDGAK